MLNVINVLTLKGTWKVRGVLDCIKKALEYQMALVREYGSNTNPQMFTKWPFNKYTNKWRYILRQITRNITSVKGRKLTIKLQPNYKTEYKA